MHFQGMDKTDNSNSDIKKNSPKEINISTDTATPLENLTISDILDSETIKMGIKTLINFLGQSADNEKSRIDITNKELDNQIELRKLDIAEMEIELKAEQLQQKHMKWFDIRNKIYSFIILLVVIFTTVVLKAYDILDKSEVRLIIIIALTAAAASNTDLLNKVLNNKKDD